MSDKQQVFVMSVVKVAGVSKYMNRVWPANVIEHDEKADKYHVHIPAFDIDLWVDSFYVHLNWTGPYSGRLGGKE